MYLPVIRGNKVSCPIKRDLISINNCNTNCIYFNELKILNKKSYISCSYYKKVKKGEDNNK